MNHRNGEGALVASTLIFALLIAGCSDYGGAGDDDDSGTGGTAASQATGGVGAGGTVPTGGVDAVGTGGGDAVEASCDDVQPCGGDVLGTWTVSGSCVSLGGEIDLSALGVGCQSGTITGSTLDVSGTVTFNADANYEDNLTWTGEELFDLIGDCRKVSGTTTTCDRLGIIIAGQGYIEGLNYETVVCTPTGPDPVPGEVLSGCNCTATINQAGTTAGYESADNALTNSNGAEYAYCVEGTTLTFTPTKFALGSSTTNTGTVVLQKQ